jgi:hypothetical protein
LRVAICRNDQMRPQPSGPDCHSNNICIPKWLSVNISCNPPCLLTRGVALRSKKWLSRPRR